MMSVMRIVAFIKNLGIQRKLLLAFTLLIVVPLYLLGIQIYQRSSEIIRMESRTHLEYAAYQTANNLDLLVDKILALVFSIQTDLNVQDLLTQINGQAPLSELQERIYTERLNQILVKHSFVSEVGYISIVANSGLEAQIYNAKADQHRKLVNPAKIENGKGSTVWLGYNGATDAILLGAQINSIRTQRPLGYLVMSVHQRSFCGVFSQMGYAEESEHFIVDADNCFISSSKAIEAAAVPDAQLRGLDRSQPMGFYDDAPTGSYMVYRQLQKAPWYYVARMSTDIIERPLSLLFFAIIVLEFIVIAAALMLAFLFSVTISRPITKLTVAMKQFSEGDMDIRCQVQSTNEIGQLSSCFNEMVENVNMFIGKYEREIISKQRAELKSLRMQINPHFLYNTLETINWMARMNHVPDIGVAAKSLGDLMRATISGAAFITLEKELTYLNNYVNIQKYRYQDKIDVHLCLPNHLHHCYVPKLILQPILENSIIHGLRNKSGGGTIDVSAKEADGVLSIIVSDDGVGIPPEKFAHIMDGEAVHDDHASIGLYNVDMRIKLRYGYQYGVVIHSEEGVGTTVTLTLPLQRELSRCDLERKD